MEAAKEARAAAAKHGVDIGTLAFKQSARVPGIAVHLIGMRNPEEVSQGPAKSLGSNTADLCLRPDSHVWSTSCTLKHACMYAPSLRQLG